MPVAAYALGSSNGVMVLEIGSREATWNGVQINLGFAPEFIDGEVFLHGLDLQKELEPLLCEPPLAFGTNRIIVIDPGHGGSNVGTQSALDGRLEKEFTLDWALRLKPLLETNGWTVFLTRTSDVMVSNYDRVTFAEARHADLFISLHFNSTLRPRQKDRRARNLLHHADGHALDADARLQRHLVGESSEQCFRRAKSAARRPRPRARCCGRRGWKTAASAIHGSETVLRGQNRPAILVEGGYLSNPSEAKLIENPEYRGRNWPTARNASGRGARNENRETHPRRPAAAGFIGSHLVERLLADGKSVVVIDDLSTGSLDNLAR